MMMQTHRLHISWAILALLTVGAVSGCASKETASTARAANSTSMTSADAVRARLTNTDHGLEVRNWIVLDQRGTFVDTLANYVDGQPADEATRLRLKRNGLRLLRVPVDALDSMVAELGDVVYDGNEWHGQVLEWRMLQQRPVSPEGQAVAIDGRLRRFDRGQFRIMIRSWTVQMEDGPYLQLEVQPQHHRPRPPDFRELLGQGLSLDAEPFPELALDLRLESGYAYLLVGEPPQNDWPGIDIAGQGSDAASAARPPARSLSSSSSSSSSRVGPFDGVGPDVATPRTLGELLMAVSRAEGPATARRIVAFVPKVPAELYPPSRQSIASRQGTVVR